MLELVEATYFRETLFQHTANKTNPLFQITKISSENIDIISVYRSGNSNQIEVQESFLELVDEQKRTIICGDFNICFEKNRNSRLIKGLENQGFKQLNLQPTHFLGGHIDHVYSNIDSDVKVTLYSPYYCAKDHDGLLIEVKNVANN